MHRAFMSQIQILNTIATDNTVIFTNIEDNSQYVTS